MEMDWDNDELRWTRKSKRSRRTLEAAANSDEYSAAESLILLANCGGGFCPTVSTSMKHQETPSSSATEESDHAVAGDTTAADVKKEEAVKIEEAVSLDIPLLMAPTLHNSTDHCCSVCGKVFQSHQALGGHKTSHRAATTSHKNSVAHAAANAGDKIHKCCFCNAVFPTGQALGGHKRKHYRGPPLLRKVDGIARDSPDGGATRHDARRPLLDLNMPPPPECDYEQEDHCRNWIMNYDS